jgi:hypothetical protein
VGRRPDFRRGLTMYRSLLMLCLLTSLSATLHAQDSLLGQHKIDLELKPLPAAEVLNILSLRSKAAAHSATPQGDVGRPWEVIGAEQLAGILVAVDFVLTPVQQVVAEMLGCIGFTYTESGQNVVVPFTQTEHLRNTRLRVHVAGMTEAQVLQNLFGCIGWKYEQTSAGIAAFEASAATPAAECHGFTVLR